ncbi:OmpA family protein [Treponema primitia]|uniref:OmpA family protein n=1 Tax=Treponema primitia TaxID=88058 RepID=UPI000C1FBE60|nr:OmpA family protein [Treponema primitia]
MRQVPGSAARFFLPALVLAVLAVVAPGVWGEDVGSFRFAYKHAAGDRYRILSTVHEEGYVNRKLSLRSEILNRIAVEVVEARGGTGRHRAVFQTAERALRTEPAVRSDGYAEGQSYQWEREYESEFQRDARGYITIDRRFYMPVVRNVPVFPDRDIKVGDSWSAEGHEMHDFRDSFGISEPYRIPFTANYTFLGEQEWKGRPYPAFSVSYRIFSEPNPVAGRIWPRRILGASDQRVFWDFALGQAVAYTETFRMIFELSDGRTVEYCGTAEAEIVESPRMDKEQAVRDINRDIADLGIADASARIVDEGITISLENVQFQAESAVLLPEERAKLAKISEILRRYPNRDILVGGHTALAGTEAGRMQLSQDRAASVAEYLIAGKVRGPERMVVRGYGAEKPLGDNRTEAGRRRNRRVEITILEN